MPQGAGSCWYYLRFIDPRNDRAFVDPEKERRWMPVDLYIGGAEHAVLHLLYARFWHKVLYDRGHVSTLEPFQRLVNQGMILGEVELTGYQTDDGAWASADAVAGGVDKRSGRAVKAVRLDTEQVEKRDEGFVLAENPSIRVESRAFKMSKSRGNVINPDSIVADYGADSLRMYEMFMGPLEATKPWSTRSVEGVSKFLARVWRMVADEDADDIRLNPSVRDAEPSGEQLRALHKTVKSVTDDLEQLAFNTAISRMMEFVNYFHLHEVKPRSIVEPFVLLLSPFAPHLGEELWQLLGHDETLAYEPWPAYDESLIRETQIEVPVQVNGKVRSRITVAADATNEVLEKTALADAKIQSQLDGKKVRTVIVVPGKLVNIVV
jgi:leucyl-tRNA synthetase